MTARRAAIVFLAALALAPSADAMRRRPPAPLGLVPSAPDAAGDLAQGVALARAAGADPLYWYASFADGPGLDAALRLLGERGRVALTLSVVSTGVLGRYPAPWQSFTEPGFPEALASWAAAVAARHRIAWLFVGNEAGDRLAAHPDETAAFVRVLEATARAVRAASPATRVGVSLSLRTAVERGQLESLVPMLAEHVDLIGWTVYGYVDGRSFRFERPDDGIAWLERIPSRWPHAVLETGWNSSALLGSSPESQAAFVRALRERFLPRSAAEFVSLFLLRDGRDCMPRARAFLPPGAVPPPGALERFAAFLCHFGLRDAGDAAKPAWGAAFPDGER